MEDCALFRYRISRRVFSGGLAAGLLAMPRLGAAQTPVVATPVASGEPGTLAAMLAMVPDLFGGNPKTAAGQMVTYANIAAQLAAVQVNRPAAMGRAGYPFTAILANLLLPDPLGSHFADEQWLDVFGFSPLTVDQVVQAGAPPDLVTLYRGRFDDAKIVAALQKQGYKPVQVGGLTAYSLHADASIDFTSAVSRIAMATMNNGVRLPDGTWAFATTLDRLRSAVAATQRSAASLASRPEVQAALAAPSAALATAVVVPGTALQVSAAGAALQPNPATAVAAAQHELTKYGPLPPVSLAILAVTVGGPIPPAASGATPPPAAAPSIQPVAQAEITLVFAMPASAQAAVPVLTKRLAGMRSPVTQQPYAQLFPSPSVEAMPGQPVVRLTLLPAGGRPPSIIFSMLFQRDLAFLAW